MPAEVCENYGEEYVDATAATSLLKTVEDAARWIDEAVRLVTRPNREIVEGAASIAAIEKLGAGRGAVLDGAIWANPRPFGSALTDILYAGRSSWGLSYPGSPASGRTEERVARVATESEAVIAEFTKANEDSEQHITASEARQEVTGVAKLLSERTAKSAERSSSSPIIAPDPVLIESFGLLVTLAAVMRR